MNVSTVSRALNCYLDISPATREQVSRASQELGYRPNQNARRLLNGTPETIGYLVPRVAWSEEQPLVVQLLQGVG